MIRAAILTISDRAYRGEYRDLSGPAIRELLTARGVEIQIESIVADERQAIADTLQRWADSADLDLILTTGGTGFAPRDVTPEATLDVIERQAPGLVEAMRAASLRITPYAMLSRAVAGIRGSTIIVNLPGSPKAVRENLETILPALPHAVELLHGNKGADRHPDTQA
jgi:molybdenum cofactor synthesis domain-containing protein